jgi:mannose-6-phosphate isomerase-like protein (cupin superfamily)
VFLGPNGFVGRHPTVKPQLFLVVRGVGWVRADSPERAGSDERVRIIPGQAAYWEAGEWHESGSVTGMVAIVIEGEGLSPIG